MNIDVGPSVLNLPRDGLVAVRDAEGARVECLEGAVWITEEGESRDVILEPGRCFTIRHAGLTLLMALRPSGVRVAERTTPRVGLVHRLFSDARPQRHESRLQRTRDQMELSAAGC